MFFYKFILIPSILGFYKHAGKHDSDRPDRDPLQNIGQRTLTDFAGIVCVLDNRNVNQKKNKNFDKNNNLNGKNSEKDTERYKNQSVYSYFWNYSL